MMRILFFLVSVIAMLADETTVRGELRFTRTTVKHGKVRSGRVVRHDFAFVNESSQPIHIVEMRAGCGCLAPRLTKKTYAAGEKGVIPLEVNTLGESAGEHRWYVYVQYRDGEERRVVLLQILAEVETEITMQPAAVKIRGRKQISQVLRLTDLRSKPLTITSLRCTNPQLQIQQGRPAQNRLGHWVTPLTVTMPASFPDGKHEDFLLIDTDDAIYSELKIPIEIVKPAVKKITVRPAQVEVTGTVGQALPSRLLLLQSTTTEPVVIDKYQAEHACVRCRWAKGPGNFVTVRVWVDHTKLKQHELRTMLHIHIRQPVEQVMTIPVSIHLLQPTSANRAIPDDVELQRVESRQVGMP